MDIVEQLRELADELTGCAPDLMEEAADVIEQLRADVDRMASLAIDNARDMLRLREALKNFCDAFEPHLHPERCQYCSNAYWEARAALKEGE